MQGRRWWPVIAGVALLGGCGGASAKQVASARGAVYQTEFEVVWAAARQELFDRYGLASDAPDQGVMESDWAIFDESGAKKPAPVDGADSRGKTIGVRFVVRVVASDTSRDRGWRVEVSAETPREGADQPPWVQSKIDALTVAIYEQLKGHAVTSSR